MIELNNSAPITIFTQDTLILRGRIEPKYKGGGNIRFIHAGWDPLIEGEAQFYGTLFAPNAKISLYEIDQPGAPPHFDGIMRRERSHIGAFYAHSFEAHQQSSIIHEPFRPHCIRPTIAMQTKSDLVAHGDISDSARTEEVQGVTTSPDAWYFIASDGVWKYPLQGSLKSHIDNNNSIHISNPYSSVTSGHLSAPVFARELLYIAAHKNKIVVMDPNLQNHWLVDASSLLVEDGNISWIAYDEKSERFYVSDFNAPTFVTSFEITDCRPSNVHCSEAGGQSEPAFLVENIRQIDLLEPGGASKKVLRAQGAAIADETLYMVSDIANGGIYAFDLSLVNISNTYRTATFRGFHSVPVDKDAAQRCKEALCHLAVPISNVVCNLSDLEEKICNGRAAEFEGITVRNGNIYGVMLDNDANTDSLIFKEFNILGDPTDGPCIGF